MPDPAGDLDLVLLELHPRAPAVTGPAEAPDADLALRVVLATGCEPDRALAAVRRVADALLAATSGRLRRGIAVSVVPRA